jgi:hypothetical protein
MLTADPTTAVPTTAVPTTVDKTADEIALATPSTTIKITDAGFRILSSKHLPIGEVSYTLFN